MYANPFINPFTVVIAFALILIVLDFQKPQISRIILGLFFIVMALGVNLTVLLTNPTLMVQAGANALLPVYRWFFATILAWNPVVFILPLMAFEVAVGALILSKGKWVRYGLIAGIVFCIGLIPVGIEEITTPALALALGLLLRKNFDRSLIELVAALFNPKPALPAAPGR